MSQPAMPANTWKVPFLVNQQCPSYELDDNFSGEMGQLAWENSHDYERLSEYSDLAEGEGELSELLLWGA